VLDSSEGGTAVPVAPRRQRQHIATENRVYPLHARLRPPASRHGDRERHPGRRRTRAARARRAREGGPAGFRPLLRRTNRRPRPVRPTKESDERKRKEGGGRERRTSNGRA